MPNIELRPARGLGAFRRVAAVAWDHPTDPTIYGTVHVPAAALAEWVEKKRGECGSRVTVTHAVARAVAMTLRRHPELNGLIRFRRIYLRKDVDVFLQVAIESETEVGKTDLSGVVIRKADEKSVPEMCEEIREGARKIRAGEDKDFKRTKSQASTIPSLLFRVVIKFLEFLQFGLNVNTSFLGAPRDPFGSAMVTSLGMKGVELAYAPFFPLARVPMILLVGAMDDAPAVEDGQVVVQKQLTLCATFDHRIVDGVHAATMARDIRLLLTEPERLDRDPAEAWD